jgi:hypothetical protein
MPKQDQTDKMPYVQPQLMVYGGFSQLTASGSINAMETTSGPGMGMMMRA